ncbi:siderophore ABC transporter substrate-binding protein [Propionibacterium freudenreichii]|uniref:siderophore ABC transporter substrate-binding protein n=1 Tax=Propionibacterium freudenreichii TaxID=1744 RepID=UPI0005444222|nr:ABC transporter substrate-binding protein [Propionibacterium freudenreichii]MCT2991073.1 iron ABC transporter substrate-binding protein [Propionibacterium freudenreichii]MCT2992733.1 iron ABC transporter substrate-binding protein [Propionibacterium freudenreichii]MDK9301212.1 ABC transporter substrate-binding protein [Propionibacterium freudenreichii]MDK9321375.1 ABC transporter substrate-binding protein [Propionibacterium freudenreichii]MDK9323930.1 ABC transporter substrate-binding protei
MSSTRFTNRGTLAVVALSAALLAGGLTACSSGAGSDTSPATHSAAALSSIEITDNNGTHTVTTPPQSVVALDNRTFETLSQWGVGLKAAAVSLMPSTISYTTDKSIVDIGNHREPNLEAIVAAKPDLVINGQRFTQYTDEIKSLVPDTTILDLDPRDGEPFDQELKRQTTVLGEVFGKQAEAKKLNDDLDGAIARVKKAYKPADTVMAVNTSGGEIGFIAPHVGRALGPVYDFAGLTPALQVQGSSKDHKGDDISVEAIASSNPTWILVMDRDAAISADDPSYKPASELLKNSQALAGVTAVKEGNIVTMPADIYTNESSQTYTEFLNDFAAALESRA